MRQLDSNTPPLLEKAKDGRNQPRREKTQWKEIARFHGDPEIEKNKATASQPRASHRGRENSNEIFSPAAELFLTHQNKN